MKPLGVAITRLCFRLYPELVHLALVEVDDSRSSRALLELATLLSQHGLFKSDVDDLKKEMDEGLRGRAAVRQEIRLKLRKILILAIQDVRFDADDENNFYDGRIAIPIFKMGLPKSFVKVSQSSKFKPCIRSSTSALVPSYPTYAYTHTAANALSHACTAHSLHGV